MASIMRARLPALDVLEGPSSWTSCPKFMNCKIPEPTEPCLVGLTPSGLEMLEPSGEVRDALRLVGVSEVRLAAIIETLIARYCNFHGFRKKKRNFGTV